LSKGALQTFLHFPFTFRSTPLRCGGYALEKNTHLLPPSWRNFVNKLALMPSSFNFFLYVFHSLLTSAVKTTLPPLFLKTELTLLNGVNTSVSICKIVRLPQAPLLLSLLSPHSFLSCRVMSIGLPWEAVSFCLVAIIVFSSRGSPARDNHVQVVIFRCPPVSAMISKLSYNL